VSLQGGKQSDPWAQVGIYTSLGFVLFGGIAGGYFLGWILDRWLGTAPVLSLVIAAVGFTGGFIEVLRILQRLEKRDDGNSTGTGSGSS
jgi:F0F1-type ATP synthase assembly protein I